MNGVMEPELFLGEHSKGPFIVSSQSWEELFELLLEELPALPVVAKLVGHNSSENGG